MRFISANIITIHKKEKKKKKKKNEWFLKIIHLKTLDLIIKVKIKKERVIKIKKKQKKELL